MFIGKFFLFQCNGCGIESYCEKFPKNWIFTTGITIEHFCPKCTTQEMTEKFQKMIHKRNEQTNLKSVIE